MSLPLAPPIFEDPASQALQQAIEAAALTRDHVLLYGAAGTGKRRTARYLHDCSRKAGGPFLAVDCSALDPRSLGVAMRGHEAGAVRGGFTANPGWFEVALDGTLFLDEIQTLTLSLQDELLAIMRSGEVQRIGAARKTLTNVRLACATSVDLTQAVAQGRFRPDLFALISAVTLRLPDLSERPADILPLARQFMEVQSHHLKQPVPILDDSAVAALRCHDWPGHIRELEVVMQSALMRCEVGRLRAEDLMLPPPRAATDDDTHLPEATLLAELDALLGRLGERFSGRLFVVVEHCLFRHAHQSCGRHQIQAARLLGVSRNVLRGRLIAMGEIDARK